ncbi:MAG: hypothetical protein IKP40_14360 [Clostridia bacterium]|nr:hypothetical protein [Clostridia bacterium]
MAIAIILTFALCAVMGYLLMGRMDDYISHHVISWSECEPEEQQNESPGKCKWTNQTYTRMPVFVHLQRKGYSRCIQSRCSISGNDDRLVCRNTGIRTYVGRGQEAPAQQYESG